MGTKNSSTSHGDQPMLHNLGMSKHGNLKKTNGTITMNANHVGKPKAFGSGKSNATTTASVMK
jgi:hypothetical protein